MKAPLEKKSYGEGKFLKIKLERTLELQRTLVIVVQSNTSFHTWQNGGEPAGEGNGQGQLGPVIGSEAKGAGVSWSRPGGGCSLPNSFPAVPTTSRERVHLATSIWMDLDDVAGDGTRLGFGNTASVCCAGRGEFLSIIFY